MQKIIVVGAGILGAATAYHLTKLGAEVTVVDRSDDGQATDAAAGIICPWLSQRRNQKWYKLAKGGARHYPTLIQMLEADGEVDTGYKQVGAISVRQEEEKLAAMEERAQKRKQDAPEIGEITRLTPAQTKAIFPPLADGYSAIHISGAARVDGRRLRESLKRAAKKNGATIIEGDAKILHENARVTGVSVNGNNLHADQVIVTAGVWAKELLKPLGVNFLIEPQKAQIVHLQLPDTDTSDWPLVMPPSDQYILAFEDHIVAGSTHENDMGLDYRVTPIGLHEIFGKVLAIAPGLSDSTLLDTRVGFRPVAPGFLPIVGPLPGFENILVANGLGSSGLTSGPYIGSELDKLAVGHETEIDISDYPVSGAIE